MRGIALTSLVFISSMAAADFVPENCYERAYEDHELAQVPSQIVDRIQLQIGDLPDYDGVYGTLHVRFADRGRLEGRDVAGATVVQLLTCWERASGQMYCEGQCDGSGGLHVMGPLGNESVLLVTEGLWAEDPEYDGPDCNPLETIVPILGEPAAYRLDRRPVSLCEGF